MRAKDILSSSVMPLKPSDTGALAASWMVDFGVTHLPVVDKDILLGVVSNTDIDGMDDVDLPIGKNKLPLSRSYVYGDVHLFDMLRLAATEKLSLIPVLDDQNRYIGSITRFEIIQAMAGYTSVTQPGGIIVLEIGSQQYALSEIARIIEANDAKVLSAAITSADNSQKLEVTVKVSVMDLSSIIQTFNRYDYIVKASFAEESQYDTLLSERYEALMKFLQT